MGRPAHVASKATLLALGILLAVAVHSHAHESGDADVVSDEPQATTTASSPWASPVFTSVRAEGGLAFHREMFFVPATWSADYRGRESEILMQISFKARLLRTRFYGGYTQKSFWQAYNSAESSPFRDTNHAPELFYRMTPSNSSFENWGFDAGIEHESNGQTVERSRSWNRLFFAPHYRWKRAVLYGKAWYRIREDACPEQKPLPTQCDNNPDITDFLGHGEVHLYYQLTQSDKPQLLHVALGGNPAKGKGWMSMSYSYPARTTSLFFYARAWHGYGESLLDYNRSITRVGLGFAFAR